MKLFGTTFRKRTNKAVDELPVPQDKTPLRDQETESLEIADEELKPLSEETSEEVSTEEVSETEKTEETETEDPTEEAEETEVPETEEVVAETAEAEETTAEAEGTEASETEEVTAESAETESPETEEEASGQETSGEEGEEETKGIKFSLMWKPMLISFAVCLVVFIGAAALIINYFLGLINYQSADSDYFATVSAEQGLEEETYEDSYLQALDEAELADDLEASPEDLQRWNDHIDTITSDNSTFQVPISSDVYNILLIGTDNRSVGAVGRSDVMMLVSINHKTETIYLTSFLRDCYVSIPGYGKTRINHSFAYGGPDLLMETLETNFKVHVDKYATVDFFSFMDVIDTLGGVWIYMSDEEVRVANKYIWSMNKLMGLEWSDGYIWGDGYDGWHYLSGKQALGHARNRFTGSDYERTARQRDIINQVITGAMGASPSTLVDLAQVILPQITTDMTKSEILNYAANIGAYVNYDIQQLQIPAAGTYSGATISGMSVISLNLEENIEFLQGTIYEGVTIGSAAE